LYLKKTKNLFLIIVLIFSIVSSISTGTIATYTKTLEPVNGSVTARYFYIGLRSEVILDAAMAPGETAYREFIVTNANNNFITEVDMDMNLELQSWTPDGYIEIKDLSVKIEKFIPHEDNGNNHDNGNGKWELLSNTSTIKGNGILSEKIENAFKANISSEYKFRIVIDWPKKSTYDDSELPLLKNNLKLVINGTQHIN
jgi:hypothetical protein